MIILHEIGMRLTWPTLMMIMKMTAAIIKELTRQN
jgi:hypothetical protein